MARLEAREKEEGDLARELGSREKDSETQQGRLKAGLDVSSSRSSPRIEDRRGEIVHRISKIAALNNFLQGVLANAEKVSAELFKLEAEVAEVDAGKGAARESLGGRKRELESERGKRERLTEEREALESEAREDGAPSSNRPRPRARPGQGRAFRTSGPLVVSRGARRRPGSFRSGRPSAPHARERERGVFLLGSVADAIDVEPGLERAAEAFLDSALQRVRVQNEARRRSGRSSSSLRRRRRAAPSSWWSLSRSRPRKTFAPSSPSFALAVSTGRRVS